MPAALVRHAPAVLALAVTAAVIGWQRRTITHLRDAHTAALAQLNHDHLTGLLNRTGFRRDLTARLLDGRAATVILVDVDDFKTINDTYGHAVGDLALQHLATQLGTVSQRESAPATAARLSGDEFAVLVDGDMTAAQRLAREISHSLGHTPLTYNGEHIAVHLSIGLAAYTTADRELSVDDLLARADHAMYHAKRRPTGTPPIATWTPGLHMPPPSEPGERRVFRQPAPRPSR